MSSLESSAPIEKRERRKPSLQVIIGGPLVLAGVFAAGLFASRITPLVEHGDKPASVDQPELQYEERVKSGGRRVKTTYFRIEGPFTTNLLNTDRLVQVEIGISTHYDERVVEAVAAHDVAIRSAILSVLAQQREEDFASLAGRTRLQSQLKSAINRVLVQETSFGGVHNVYFVGLIIQ